MKASYCLPLSCFPHVPVVPVVPVKDTQAAQYGSSAQVKRRSPTIRNDSERLGHDIILPPHCQKILVYCHERAESFAMTIRGYICKPSFIQGLETD